MSLFAPSADDPLYPQGFRVNVSDLLLASFTINILSLALPIMTLQVYDRILPNPGSGTLAVLITGVCVAIVLECVMRLGRSYVVGWAGASFEHRLSCRAMNHILNADLSIPSSFGIGENLNRLGSIGRLSDFYNGYSLITLFELMFVPLFLILIAYIAGPVVIVPTVILMTFTIISLIQGKNLRRNLEMRDDADDKRYNFLIESLEGIHTIKSFALENMFSRRYEALEEKSTIANFNVTESAASAFNTGAVFSNIMVTAVIAVGAIFVLDSQITVGALIASILLSGRIMQPTQRALALWAKYQDYTLSRRKVESIFEIPLHRTAPLEGEIPEREGTLSLNNVSFRPSDSAPWLLEDVNLTLDRGDCIAIKSDDTASKTALLDLIAGIYAPTRGEVMVDRCNTLRYTPEELINHVGYIQPEGLIFRGTIRDNMTCFGQIPETKVQEIATLLHVDKDIAGLPSGFDTYLNGSSADTIPPGLKQRISMVRVLAPKPRIILFDNADRSLDREGYNLVYNLLARLKQKATLIICSDDYNLATQASRHYSIQKARLTEINQQKGI